MASVVFMGTPDFAAGILRSLIESEYEVKAVFTQPDRPKGRKGILQMPPVKELALRSEIPVYQPEKIRFTENVQILKDLQPDMIVVAAFGQIIPQSILDIPRFGCLNVHASLLPAWRGAAPIQWSILAGDQVTGVTIMRMDAGLDTGDMILKKEVAIREDETGDSLFDVLMEEGARALLEAMEQVFSGSAVYTPQSKESPTPYAKMLSRQSGLIDWTMDAEQIARMVRAYYSWPGTYTFLHSKMLKILKAAALPETENDAGMATETVKASVLPESEKDAGMITEETASQTAARKAAPGEILLERRDELLVGTGRGVLRVLEVQPEGKKRMDVAAYLRGSHLTKGERFSDRREE